MSDIALGSNFIPLWRADCIFRKGPPSRRHLIGRKTWTPALWPRRQVDLSRGQISAIWQFPIRCSARFSDVPTHLCFRFHRLGEALAPYVGAGPTLNSPIRRRISLHGSPDRAISASWTRPSRPVGMSHAARDGPLSPRLRQLLAQRRQRPVFHLVRQGQGPDKVAQIVDLRASSSSR